MQKPILLLTKLLALCSSCAYQPSSHFWREFYSTYLPREFICSIFVIRPYTKATSLCDFSLELDGTALKHVTMPENRAKITEIFSGYKYLSTSSVGCNSKKALTIFGSLLYFLCTINKLNIATRSQELNLHNCR